MKKRMFIWTVITLVILLACFAGAVILWRMRMIRPVKVVPVSSVSLSQGNKNVSISGSIVSRDTQTVELNTDYQLKKVYVKEGDRVKRGAPLLEYDMTVAGLKLEMAKLTRQSLELEEQVLKKKLEKLKNTRPSASLAAAPGVLTAAGDGLLEEEDGLPAQTAPQSPAPAPPEASGQNKPGDGDILIPDPDTPETGNSADDQGNTDPGSPSPSTPGQDGSWSGQEGLPDNPGSEDQTETLVPGETAQTEGILEDPTESQEKETDDLLLEPGEEEAAQKEILEMVNRYLTRVNQLSVQELDQLIPSDISEAKRIYQEFLSDSQETEVRDLLGEQRKIRYYSLKPQVTAVVGENTAQMLSKAYDRVCVYGLISSLGQLSQEFWLPKLSDRTQEEIIAVKEQILDALDQYYDLYRPQPLEPVWDQEEYRQVLAPRIETLAELARLLNLSEVLETESETETESQSEMMDFPDGGFSDFGDPGSGYTADELKKAILELENDLEENQLKIREEDLNIKKLERILGEQVIKSSMDGIVKKAGSLKDKAVKEDEFVVVSGTAGLFLRGSLHEEDLDEIKVGSKISGTTYDTFHPFTATITEIGKYPVSKKDFSYGENANASRYPFWAYIDEAQGLEEGGVSLEYTRETASNSVYLEKYMVRRDEQGSAYVLVEGEKGRLIKRPVTVGRIDSSGVEIREGLAPQDWIAFPYGRGVREGARILETDMLFTDPS